MAQARKKDTKSRSLINLRVSPEDRRLIDRAATATGKNRSEFMLNAARFAAEEALLDKVLFRVDAKTYDGLIAYLDEPPSADANLRKLMQTTPPWRG
ncbi:CopG-like DNA-binding (plasmid) [Nitrobacter hamburgensis X14]|uniref:CopG-like DNA-binding n=1 Tax=Nitrobacter hamburgensis (strain DSM 10229 / NCIMB 13809 / X14) TaxID=323097 RepID=Q1QF38_NITHX|nr:DUF1778 domain-containing protein [Nitrobacter hamburgensis]ABE65159.1 CopG-like DNA-binding [Nitrobacter hamburgensis X14]